MTDHRSAPHPSTDLRIRAHVRLNRPDGTEGGQRPGTVAALSALHGLASSASTAPEALALLHELQVHQVELDLQAEELLRSRAELEAALQRQARLYDFAPVGCLAVDRQLRIGSLNRTAATLLGLGHDRDALVGRSLDAFLTPSARVAVRSMLDRVATVGSAQGCMAELQSGGADRRVVQVRAVADATDGCFALAFMEIPGGH